MTDNKNHKNQWRLGGKWLAVTTCRDLAATDDMQSHPPVTCTSFPEMTGSYNVLITCRGLAATDDCQ